jgi:hypothetical protein
MSDQPDDNQPTPEISPLHGGEGFPAPQQEMLAARRGLVPPAAAMTGLVAGGLYGTDGANLYLIDRTTGAASLIGAHGAVEVGIGAIAFDPGGTLFGISLTAAAQLYRIDVTTGAATAIGPLGIGFVFEGGLTFDANGRLIGVNQGNAAAAQAFEVNTATGAATLIGPAGGQARDIDDLTREGSVIYAIDRPTNTLGTLDPATGTYTVIGATGATVGDTGGLAFCAEDGRLYATFAADGGFYTIDKATGAATLIAINNVDFGLACAPVREPAKLVSYSVKFVCGFVDGDHNDDDHNDDRVAEGIVRPGVYATEINIHNYHDVEVAVRKHVLPLVFDGKPRGREPDYVKVQAQDGIVLPPNTATMDDCHRIAQLLYGGPPPQPLPLMIGYLEIVSTLPLAVDAVYTVSDRGGRAVAIDVERVEGRPKDRRG